MKTLTKKEVMAMFLEHVLPAIQRTEQEQTGRVDLPMRSEAWNNFVDSLQKDGQISRRQADTWVNPW